MILRPITSEWIFVYVPLGLALVVASAIELTSNRVPNWLVLTSMAYFFAARMAVGPDPMGFYCLSLLGGGAISIGAGWLSGYLGGGAAKLAAAISLALPPLQAVVVCSGLVVMGFMLEKTHSWHGVQRLPGPVALLGLSALTIGFMAVFGRARA